MLSPLNYLNFRNVQLSEGVDAMYIVDMVGRAASRAPTKWNKDSWVHELPSKLGLAHHKNELHLVGSRLTPGCSMLVIWSDLAYR